MDINREKVCEYNMEPKELLTSTMPYSVYNFHLPHSLKENAEHLCWEYNQLPPGQEERRGEILGKLFGTCHPKTFVMPGFRCDYGFNIHTHGLAFINYNCVILDTSPVHIGANAFIAPGVCISCVSHAIDAQQRADVITTSAPITLEDDVWIGANAVICGGVTIGKGAIIGAGSVVTRDIPAGVVAAGTPCRPLRPVTEADKIDLSTVSF